MRLVDFIEANFITKTDKYDLGYIHSFYDELFTPRQDTAKHVLEIGIYRGDSIRLWQQYFHKAEIIGVDVNQCPALEGLKRVKQVTENAYSKEFVSKLEPKFDIIIDDGPHTFESMVFFLENYVPLLADGGVLILEDIIDPSWTPKLLELVPDRLTQVYDMRGKQKNAHLLDLWKNGLDVIVISE
jgi:23S rRNA U2552 (ribose-2'-O)-methylase RlmE/FtsJ